jgi:hypothetical protein
VSGAVDIREIVRGGREGGKWEVGAVLDGCGTLL